MAVTIVATAGSASANSFVTEAEAEAYMAARLNASAWTGTESIKQALIEATREISALDFSGYRTDTTQALSWPRYDATNPDAPSGESEVYEDDVIPQRIKDATIELAFQFLKAGTVDVAALPSTDGIVRRRVDVLEVEYAPLSQRASGIGRFPRVAQRLSGLLASGSNAVVRS